ncbi:hypothetical protein IMY05_C4794000300 [Salix suchowensis]|nr:hypothetical protein IMY05_C4794000300 [Salix suchowensis]
MYIAVQDDIRQQVCSMAAKYTVFEQESDGTDVAMLPTKSTVVQDSHVSALSMDSPHQAAPGSSHITALPASTPCMTNIEMQMSRQEDEQGAVSSYGENGEDSMKEHVSRGKVFYKA